MKLYITFFLFLVLMTIAFIFGSQNEQSISLNYLIAKTEMSVATAVSLFTSIGFFLGLLTALIVKLSRKMSKNKNK